MAKAEGEEDDGVVLICLPVRPNQSQPIEGSALRECSDCRCPIWLAPTGEKIAKARGAELVCLDCAAKRIKDDDDVQWGEITPEQIAEIKAQLRRDRDRARLRKYELPN